MKVNTIHCATYVLFAQCSLSALSVYLSSRNKDCLNLKLYFCV